MTNGHRERGGYAKSRGAGWVTFAGIMILMAGLFNTVGGIAAIDNADFYVDDAPYQFGALGTWGLVLLLIGIMQLFAAFSIWAGGAYGRWIGVTGASLNAVAQLFFVPAFPLWSLAIFSLDLLIIYGLVIYGDQRPSGV